MSYLVSYQSSNRLGYQVNYQLSSHLGYQMNYQLIYRVSYQLISHLSCLFSYLLRQNPKESETQTSDDELRLAEVGAPFCG